LHVSSTEERGIRVYCGFILCEVYDMSSTFASALADTTLPDADGTLVRLGSLWQTGPAVLVFLRHYG